jgi:hypothetical protein
MRHFAVFILTLIAAASTHATAIVLDQTYETAAALGLAVLGEVEFQNSSAVPNEEQIRELVREARLLCQTQDSKLILFSWSDLEYPAPGIHHPVQQVRLAARRAEALRARLLAAYPEDHAPGLVAVNMATRQPFYLTRGMDLKRVLERSGSAPSDPYLLGLFGEYAQRSKVLAWADCRSTQRPTRRAPRQFLKLALVGQFTPISKNSGASL